MLTKKITAVLVFASLGLVAGRQMAYANCVTEAMTAVPYFNLAQGQLVIPLIELSATASGDAAFLATTLEYQTGSNPPSFALSQALTNPGNDCEYISIPVANFDMNTQQLYIPTLTLAQGADEVAFYSARLQLENGVLTLIPDSLTASDGRYTGVVYNQETQQPLKDAKVSLDGVAAEQATNAAGHFTITGIGNSICQTLTINGEGFAPMVKDVDIRLGGLTACQTAE